jgi:hypothetical protein
LRVGYAGFLLATAALSSQTQELAKSRLVEANDRLAVNHGYRGRHDSEPLKLIQRRIVLADVPVLE